MEKEYSQKTTPIKYCSACGKRMLCYKVGAEECFSTNGFDTFQAGTAYNKETGKRQYCLSYKCPDKRWYNHHDKYFIDEIITS